MNERTTYYGAPLLRKPHWEWEVVTYLFLGGLMGGSAMLAAFGDASGDAGDREMVRNARYISLVLAAACPVILIKHLGRPERFHHMLRIFKSKSVMSMGVWSLVAFSNVAVLTALAEVRGKGRSIAMLSIAQALLGAFIAGYTGVLISATAIPLWAKGKRHIPSAFVCSSLAAACALNAALLAGKSSNAAAARKLERLEAFSSLCEAVLLVHFKRAATTYGEPMFAGARGRRLRNWTFVGGIGIPVACHLASSLKPITRERKFWLTRLASALTLSGGYVLRETLIEAGKASADDPQLAFRQPE